MILKTETQNHIRLGVVRVIRQDIERILLQTFEERC